MERERKQKRYCSFRETLIQSGRGRLSVGKWKGRDTNRRLALRKPAALWIHFDTHTNICLQLTIPRAFHFMSRLGGGSSKESSALTKASMRSEYCSWEKLRLCHVFYKDHKRGSNRKITVLETADTVHLEGLQWLTPQTSEELKLR